MRDRWRQPMLACVCWGAVAAAAQEAPSPSLALLEYLGEMAEVDGRLLGPEELGAEEFESALENSTAAQQKEAATRTVEPVTGANDE